MVKLSQQQWVYLLLMFAVDIVLAVLFVLALVPIWSGANPNLLVPDLNLLMAPLVALPLLAMPTIFFARLIWTERIGREFYFLPLRLALGYEFLHGGLEKLLDTTYLSSPGLIAYGAAAAPSEWVRAVMTMMLPNYAFYLLLIAVGELLVGLSMLFGGLTRLGALGGILLHLVFLVLLGWLSLSTFGVNLLGIFAFFIVGMHQVGRFLGVDQLLVRYAASTTRHVLSRLVNILT